MNTLTKNDKSSKLGMKFLLILSVLLINFSTVSVPFLSFSTVAEAATYHEGVNKTVTLNKDTVRWYVSKSNANKMVKSGLTASILIPGSGTVGIGIKVLLALFGIWGEVPGGFSVDIQKDNHGRPPYYHNFKWQ